MSTQAERTYMANASRVESTTGNNTNQTRTIPMKVICPGLSRSGTGAMRQALEILGIGRTFHGLRLSERPGDMDVWIELVRRKFPGNGVGGGGGGEAKGIEVEDFDAVLGDCAAVTDMPCSAFWRELLLSYPSAKIILVERNLNDWYRSFDQAVIQGLFSRKGRVLGNHWVAGFINYRNPEMLQRLFLAYFGARDKWELAENAKRVYVEHNEAVRRVCREEGREFLEFKLESGWEPLCEFLGVEAPKDREFPRGNEASVLLPFIHKAQRELLLRAATKLVRRSAVVGAVVGVLVMLRRRPDVVRSWLSRVYSR